MFQTYESRIDRKPATSTTPVLPVKPSTFINQLANKLPRSISLGCAGWNYAGWKGLVWDTKGEQDVSSNAALGAYAKHPLFNAVGIDRSFYGNFNEMDYADMARRVEDDHRFKFLVKAPASVTDCVNRDKNGRFQSINEDFLNVRMAMHEFVYPVINGLGEKSGPMIFQLSPIPKPLLPTQKECYEYIDRITQFFTDLPKVVEGEHPVYGLEIRTLSIYTKRLLNQLRNTGVRLTLGLHPSMPDIVRQSAALRYFEDPESEGPDWKMRGPLLVRWALNPMQKHGVGKLTYSPFDKLVHPDHDTRAGIAHLIALAEKSQQPSFVIVNNKAEGCAPLSIVELAKEVVGKVAP